MSRYSCTTNHSLFFAQENKQAEAEVSTGAVSFYFIQTSYHMFTSFHFMVVIICCDLCFLGYIPVYSMTSYLLKLFLE